MAIALVSGIEVEARVGAQVKYLSPAPDRPNGIEFHGRHFFVNSADRWRNNLMVYVLVAGGFLIVAGRSVRKAK
ncbi:hypothetical protein IAG41_06870 [Sphingomonas sp. JC676]|uniref:hypothetical protein n=1 Tax=Sphingomonas sp. JC676 TaxID=2768065 RepID=UPI0016578E84|nr:hypothetical protein [Sphingomonas sp. JC676]MBC9032110.1 hypothetical protein [Sphingomonas sp. JC676]